MLAILKKEINSFFSTPVGYLVIAVFLIANGLFLWVFNGDFNILNAGFADLNSFFFLAPWIFIFLIPAITMRTFSDEYNSGTIEILKTKPISDWQIIFGKYLASFILIILTLIPTLMYVYSVYKLGNPEGNFDVGSMLGSYIGLLLLAATYTAIGLFSSTFSNNQIVAFIISVCLSFFLFYGFEAASSLFGNSAYSIQQFGINEHYKSISRGVIDTRDVVYFFSIMSAFLLFTKLRLERE